MTFTMSGPVVPLVSAVCVLLLAAAQAESNVGVESVAADEMTRDTRNFGRQNDNNPFLAGKHDNLIDWKAMLAKQYSKRQLGSYTGGFGSYPALDKTDLQNWNDYFTRKYRSFSLPTHRTGQLRFGTNFGSDGLQNWRAFFDNRRFSR